MSFYKKHNSFAIYINPLPLGINPVTPLWKYKDMPFAVIKKKYVNNVGKR